MGEKVFTASTAFDLAERVVGVRERFDDQERCAFAFGAFVPHDFFD